MRRPLAVWSIVLVVGASAGWGAAAQDSRQEPPPVATIDGHPVTRAELLRHLIDSSATTIANALVLEAILEIELKKAGISLTDEEVAAEQARLVERPAQGGSIGQMAELGFLGQNELRKQARLSAGWARLFAAARKDAEPESRPNEILKQLFIRQVLDHYEVAKRGADPAPRAGLVAEIRELEGTESREVGEDQAAAFVLGLVQPESLRESASDLVDSLLVDRELARAGKSVAAAEVDAFAQSMNEKYKPPFDWRMVCQFKRTTPERERERWRRVQAWKRLTGWKLDEKELAAFLARNKERLAGTHGFQGRRKAEDLQDPSFRELVVDELETQETGFWLTGLRTKARIWIAPDEELARILKAK